MNLKLQRLSIGLIIFVLLLAYVLFASGNPLPETLRYPYSNLLESRAKSRTAGFQQEIAFYLTRIEQNPNDGLDRAALSATYLNRARVTGDAASYFLAEQSAQRSLAALPFLNPGALLVLAEVALAQHNFVAAQGYLEQLKKITPNSAAVLSLQSTMALAVGDVPKAAKSINILMRGIPNASYLVLLGLLREAQGLDAKTNYLAALKLEEADDPVGSARTRTFLARWYLRHGQLKLARDLLLEALRIVPNDAQAAMLLADSELQLGNLDAATSIYQRLAQQSKAIITVYNHAALRGLARVQRLRGQDSPVLWQQAKDSLRLELKNGAFGHARELAALLLEQGLKADLPEALKLAQQEARVRSDSQTLHILAWAQLSSGQAELARATILRAMRFGVQDAVLMQRMGLIQMALGDQTKAQIWFGQAKTLNPAFDARLLRVLALENKGV